MTERDKVIAGLKCCKDMHTAGSGYAQSCIECPYKDATPDGMMGFACIRELFGENIAFLEAQKPRVMTLEEVNALDWDYCYLEEERLPGKEYRDVCGKYRVTCVTWPSITAIKLTRGSSGYGRTWRCWTERPTDAQREATPWA